MKITSKSQLTDDQNFSMDLFKEPFCSNELNKFKRAETIKDFKNKSFFSASKEFNNLGKILIVSGPARNGNHLLVSLLDYHSQILPIAGEDCLFREFLSRVKENEDKAINDLTGKNNIEYILGMSGAYFDKWKTLHHFYKDRLVEANHIWTGQQKDNSSPSYDFQEVVPEINYLKFKEYLFSNQKKIQNIENFLDFFVIYLKALKYLVGIENNHNLKYPYFWCLSGIRRELFFLLERCSNIICLSPIRKFETFYHSYAKSRFYTNDVEQEPLNELWEYWRHKTIDYLILKNKYPKNINLIQFEDLITNRKKTITKILNNLDIDFEESNNITSVLGKINKGNSSFRKSSRHMGKVYKEVLNTKFTNKIDLPKEYYQILEEVKKNSL